MSSASNVAGRATSIKIVELLTDRQLISSEIATILHKDINYIKTCLRYLRDVNKIYIDSWTWHTRDGNTRGGYVPMWAAGDCENCPRPESQRVSAFNKPNKYASMHAEEKELIEASLQSTSHWIKKVNPATGGVICKPSLHFKPAHKSRQTDAMSGFQSSLNTVYI